MKEIESNLGQIDSANLEALWLLSCSMSAKYRERRFPQFEGGVDGRSTKASASSSMSSVKSGENQK